MYISPDKAWKGSPETRLSREPPRARRLARPFRPSSTAIVRLVAFDRDKYVTPLTRTETEFQPGFASIIAGNQLRGPISPCFHERVRLVREISGSSSDETPVHRSCSLSILRSDGNFQKATRLEIIERSPITERRSLVVPGDNPRNESVREVTPVPSLGQVREKRAII